MQFADASSDLGPGDGIADRAFACYSLHPMEEIMNRRRAAKRLLAGIVGLASCMATAQPGEAQAPAFAGRTTLVMVDDIDCPWCRRWDRDVGPAYAASDEGRLAPLTRLRRGHVDLRGIPGLAYTPTFVLIVQGREIGRIVGYPGADFFWGEIEQLFRKGGLSPRVAPDQKAHLNVDRARS